MLFDNLVRKLLDVARVLTAVHLPLFTRPYRALSCLGYGKESERQVRTMLARISAINFEGILTPAGLYCCAIFPSERLKEDKGTLTTELYQSEQWLIFARTFRPHMIPELRNK